MVAPTERPNTVAGLVAKRDELLAFRKGLERELRTVICDLDYIEGAIRCFDPAERPDVSRYGVQYRARRGALKGFVLEALRAASEPLTSRGIAEAWVAHRGIQADDATFVLIRERVGAGLTALKDAVLAEGVAIPGIYTGWKLVSGLGLDVRPLA